LNDPTNIPHLVQKKLRQNPEPDDENMVEVVEDEPEEEPPDIHTTKKEVKKRQLDTLSSTSTVVSAHEPQETTLYPIHEDDYKENVFIKDNKQYTMYTQPGTAFEKEAVPPMFEDTYKEDVLAVAFEKEDVLLMIDDAYMEDMLTMSPKETVVLVDNYKMYKWSSMNENPSQEDVYARDYMMNNKILFDNGQEETQKTNLMYEQRTKKDDKRLAVPAIASKRGERGA
jgi:hypothetical protein